MEQSLVFRLAFSVKLFRIDNSLSEVLLFTCFLDYFHSLNDLSHFSIDWVLYGFLTKVPSSKEFGLIDIYGLERLLLYDEILNYLFLILGFIAELRLDQEL